MGRTEGQDSRSTLLPLTLQPLWCRLWPPCDPEAAWDVSRYLRRRPGNSCGASGGGRQAALSADAPVSTCPSPVCSRDLGEAPARAASHQREALGQATVCATRAPRPATPPFRGRHSSRSFSLNEPVSRAPGSSEAHDSQVVWTRPRAEVALQWPACQGHKQWRAVARPHLGCICPQSA